ncbi:unnamed protein product [Cladocopium goreaui]|uniref:Uncharacterized protein n=1 Tax=Cladocopium goreaui TaxID=2562237 RepID=A0A9P1BRP4_9DINO|nr:unnamed protein product [Cladocopium goreaui]
MTSFDPGIFQAALLRVAEATEAAVAAAKSAAVPPPPVHEEQPKTPPFQEERKSFFEERTSNSSAAASVPVTSVFDDVDVVPSTPRGFPTTRAHASGEGDFAVGSEEFEQQSTKHGGARELAALAKTVSRVMLMMGLGPAGPTGATATFLGDDSLQENQCEWKEPNAMEAAGAQHGFNMEFFLLVFAALVWSFFIWRLYKWLWKVDENHNQLCLQVAELDQYAGEIRNDCNQLQRTAAELRENFVELEQQQMMVNDTTDGVHFALVQMGGFVNLTEMTAAQRRHMYQQEAGNLVASRVMGQQRFLQVVRHQNQGSAAGQDTDETMQEHGEEEEQEHDPLAPVSPVTASDQEGPITTVVVALRDEINHALARSHFRDAAEIQHLVLLLLDNLNVGNMSRTTERNNVMNEASDYDPGACKSTQTKSHGNQKYGVVN